MELRTKIVSSVIRSLKLPPRFRLKMVKEDPVRLELSLTPSYGKNPVIVGLVESLDLVARRDREGRFPRDLQGTWDWTVRHGKVVQVGGIQCLRRLCKRCLKQDCQQLFMKN